VAGLAVIDRPDGSKQLAVAGKPLYTFSQDSPGKVTGDGVSDDFSGQHFTWHAVLADGTTSAASAASTGSGTTGSDAGRGDPGYGG
jgi:hypothetical protein